MTLPERHAEAKPAAPSKIHAPQLATLEHRIPKPRPIEIRPRPPTLLETAIRQLRIGEIDLRQVASPKRTTLEISAPEPIRIGQIAKYLIVKHGHPDQK
nr:hypothetical protein [Millionella massiliensis]